MRALACLIRERAQMRLGVFAELEPGDRALPQLDQPRAQAVGPFRAFLDEAVRLEHDEQPVHRALVQAKLPRDVGGRQIRFGIGDRLQYRYGSIEHLHPVAGRRRLGTCLRVEEALFTRNTIRIPTKTRTARRSAIHARRYWRPVRSVDEMPPTPFSAANRAIRVERDVRDVRVRVA